MLSMSMRLLTAVFLTSVGSLCAAPPSEFLDVPWGAPIAEAKRIFALRPGATLKEESASRLVFEGGTFADYPAERYELEMPEGRFARGTVFVVIPPGKSKNGTLLRNLQFEE
jgi:hypothetical protein